MVRQQQVKKTSVVISKRSWIVSEPVRLKAKQTARLCSANSCNGARSKVGGDDNTVATHGAVLHAGISAIATELMPVRKRSRLNAYFD